EHPSATGGRPLLRGVARDPVTPRAANHGDIRNGRRWTSDVRLVSSRRGRAGTGRPRVGGVRADCRGGGRGAFGGCARGGGVGGWGGGRGGGEGGSWGRSRGGVRGGVSPPSRYGRRARRSMG